MDVGNKIQLFRNERNLSQKELAIAVGVTRPTISDWDLGKKNPSGERLFKVAEFFDVSTGVVLGYEPIPNPTPVLFVDNGQDANDANHAILEARERVRRDPERGVLFSMATNADIADVRRAIAIIKALESADAPEADTDTSDM